jgi:hypothetical protein
MNMYMHIWPRTVGFCGFCRLFRGSKAMSTRTPCSTPWRIGAPAHPAGSSAGSPAGRSFQRSSGKL